MKKILLLLLVVILILPSCGLFRNVSKHKEKHETVTEEKSKTNEISEVTDKSVVKEVIAVDTTVSTKKKEFNVSTPLDLKDLLKGIVTVDSSLFTISQRYDEHSKKLITNVVLKPQAVDFSYNKTTTTQKDIKQNINKSEAKENKKSNLDQTSDVKKETSIKGILTILGIIALVIGLIFLVTYLGKKFNLMNLIK